MKKIVCAFLILVTFFSCSNDKEEKDLIPGSGSSVLLTQVVINYPNNETYTKQYSYENSDKLSEIVDSNGNREYYTYDGDFITKIEYVNTDPNFLNERFFTYNAAGRLTEEIFLYHHNEVGQRTVFNYATDGVVTYQKFSGNLTSQTVSSHYGSYVINDFGDILSNEEYNSSDSSIFRILTYGYDGKNSPFLNVRDASVDFNYVLLAREHNVESFSLNLSGTALFNYTSIFEYNNADYPIMELKQDASGTAVIGFTYN